LKNNQASFVSIDAMYVYDHCLRALASRFRYLNGYYLFVIEAFSPLDNTLKHSFYIVILHNNVKNLNISPRDFVFSSFLD